MEVVHIAKGLVIRLDDHFDLVFLVHGYARIMTKVTSFNDFKKHLDERFPGTTCATHGCLRSLIFDFVARAMWPGRSILIITNPYSQGGKGPGSEFNAFRMEILASEY